MRKETARRRKRKSNLGRPRKTKHTKYNLSQKGVDRTLRFSSKTLHSSDRLTQGPFHGKKTDAETHLPHL